LAPFAKVTFTVEDAYRAGLVRAYLEKRGTPLGPYDILLASQAFERNLTLATNNVREFRRVKGLRVEDWSG
jgi:tRNA(fMet)-specific endonuclease VapC